MLSRNPDEGSLQANRYNECNRNSKHFWSENSFDVVSKSHHMDNNENLYMVIVSKDYTKSINLKSQKGKW